MLTFPEASFPKVEVAILEGELVAGTDNGGHSSETIPGRPSPCDLFCDSAHGYGSVGNAVEVG